MQSYPICWPNPSHLHPQHYPGRLKRLFLVGLPPDLAWVLDTQLRPLLHPTTRAAIRACSPGDPALPALPGLGSLGEEDPPESPATPASLQNGTVRRRALWVLYRLVMNCTTVPFKRLYDLFL